MFKNYFVLAVRNFWKHKVFSLINIAGLAIGISASLVIYLIVHYEFSFEKSNKDGDRIYRVITIMHFPDMPFKLSGVPAPLPAAARKELTGIKELSAFHLYPGDVNVSIQSPNSEVPSIFKHQAHIIIADDHYFRLFSYQWLAGSAESLQQPFQLILSESRARAYFPFSDITKAVGQSITYNDSIKLTVGGIVKDRDDITDFTFKEFVSYSTIENSGLKNHLGWDQWGSTNSASQCFMKLSPGTAPSKINKQLADLRKKYAKNGFLDTDHLLQSLYDIHFNPDYDNFDQRQAHIPTLYGLLLVAAFLLLLGCINFINLTTAQAAQRAKEIGIRKTMGGSKAQLVFQFLSETFFLTIIATLLSLALVPGVLKIFSDYVPPDLRVASMKQPHIIIFIIILIIVVSILSGSYPSLVLSRYKPVLVLKNQAFSGTARTRKAWLRKTLTITQFIIAQFFIMATLLVGKQIRYSLNKDLGYKKEAILNVETPWNERKDDKRQVLLNKLRSIPEIEMISLSGAAPATAGSSSQTMKFFKGKKEIESTTEVKYADSTYFKLYKMHLIAGRYPINGDSMQKEYLINETYMRLLGYDNPQEIIGKYFERGEKKIPIVGVMADIHTKSLHIPIMPLTYSNVSANHFTYHIALKPKGEDGTVWNRAIGKIEKAWKEVYPENDFSYQFFDQRIASLYKEEQNISRLLMWATGLAIFISCLGLLGLVIYTTTQRSKEIGVRKVLGASVSQIVSLLSKDFLQLVLLAFVIATPLAWWAMYEWLQNFAYRTSLSWWIFLSSGSVMMLIALITLSIQTIRSAMANPVNSLRTE